VTFQGAHGKRNQRFRHNIRRGAVPLGQHSHSPDRVLGPVPPATVAATAPSLPLPARDGQTCGVCGAPATLRPPGPQTWRDAYCSVCWLGVERPGGPRA
jgi:hypothetical protein